MDAELKIGTRSVEAIARRVVELLRAESTGSPTGLVDAVTLANELGVERDWVYSHAADLGAIRLGGPRGRLRFDRGIVRERLEASDKPSNPTGRRRTSSRDSAPRKPSGGPRTGGVESAYKQRRASGSTPARSPRRQHPGGSPA